MLVLAMSAFGEERNGQWRQEVGARCGGLACLLGTPGLPEPGVRVIEFESYCEALRQRVEDASSTGLGSGLGSLVGSGRFPVRLQGPDL